MFARGGELLVGELILGRWGGGEWDVDGADVAGSLFVQSDTQISGFGGHVDFLAGMDIDVSAGFVDFAIQIEFVFAFDEVHGIAVFAIGDEHELQGSVSRSVDAGGELELRQGYKEIHAVAGDRAFQVAVRARRGASLRRLGIFGGRAHVVSDLIEIGHAEAHQLEQRILRRDIGGLWSAGFRIVSAPVGDFVVPFREPDADVPEFAVERGIGGSIGHGVVVPAIRYGLGNRAVESIGVVKGLAAGLAGDGFHGNLLVVVAGSLGGIWQGRGGASGKTLTGIHDGAGSIEETHRRNGIDGDTGRAELLFRGPRVFRVVGHRGGNTADRKRSGEPKHILAAADGSEVTLKFQKTLKRQLGAIAGLAGG